MWRSEPHTAVASTRIKTSPSPGRGTGTDLTSVPARPATGFVLTTAVIRVGTRDTPVPFFTFSAFGSSSSIAGLVVADVALARARSGGRDRSGRGPGVDVARDDVPGVRDA